MAKRITAFVAAVLSSLVFFSCSAIQEKSSISVSVPRNAFRAADEDSASAWSLKVSLSGGYSEERTFLIQEDSLSDTQTFTMDNLPAGERITVDVNVYYGSLLYYKTVETKQVTLAEGDNTVDIALKKAVGDGEIEVTDKFYIAAYYEDKTYIYSASSGQIPVLPYKKTISFALLTDEIGQSWTYEWVLNGVGNTLSYLPYVEGFILAENKYYIDGENTLVCYFGNAIQSYTAEFKFRADTSEASLE